MRDGDFRIRGKEISRVEGLSDAVFGFAITLLIVSLEVPKSPEEVLHMMRGFFSFAVTFFLLFMVWRTQFKFFRRYGLEDNRTVALNAVLLFTILFFVYPLKFVFTAMFEGMVFRHIGMADPNYHMKIDSGPGALLFGFYGLGWFSVFGVFTLLYRHALSKADELQLDAVELFDTKDSIAATMSASAMGFIFAMTSLTSYLLPAMADGISWISLIFVFGVLAFLIRRRRTRKTRRREMVELRTAHAE